ncbi:MAG: hypothetical protein GY789_24820 [Hyphomicrobiales bacterium]|nr:hypothetical protein [Shimia sp.]MCP4319124.1 hypothetical protein [Hyphomicrobiales bacterium]MCP5002310.1 hypothetical protein [Hyphomicrobiales bacterium]
MAAALTIAILLALSVSLVRIGAVAMRLTGLPENIARFQCVSALTGTGFTTHEAEMIVNYPIRRRIVIALMVLGNLGLISIASTFIVAFVRTGPDTQHIAVQAAIMAAAIGITFLVLTNKTLDRGMGAMIGRILLRTTSLGEMDYHRILQLGSDLSVAEHEYYGTEARPVAELDLHGENILAVRPAGSWKTEATDKRTVINPGDTLVLCGNEACHKAAATKLGGGGPVAAGD